MVAGDVIVIRPPRIDATKSTRFDWCVIVNHLRSPSNQLPDWSCLGATVNVNVCVGSVDIHRTSAAQVNTSASGSIDRNTGIANDECARLYQVRQHTQHVWT
jgi:hypothetical protein